MSTSSRLAAACGAALIGASSLLVATPGTAVAADDQCSLKKGGSITEPPWPDGRLGFRNVWSVTKGAGVRVAVMDSGVNQTLPQTSGIRYADGQTLIAPQYRLADCVNHGTAVTAIIAGQSANTPFSGVAPEATIIPLKVNQAENDTGGDARFLAAVQAAVRAHAQVANVSLTFTSDLPKVAQAVRYAKANGLLLVCSAGNDGSNGNNFPLYPAALSGQYDNVIAVSAVNQKEESVLFSSSGNYVNVAAPGDAIEAVYSGGGFGKQSGTSFAAPYVTGTVALMLAAGIPATQIRSRLEATADPPPAAVPDSHYGYGIVNPYLAVTAVNAQPPRSSAAAQASPLPPPPGPKAEDRSLQHLALGVGAGLLGLALLAGVAAAVVRSSRRGRRGARPARARGSA